MAYTATFLVKNQAMGNFYTHHIRVTADAASGAVDTGFGTIAFLQHAAQSATTAGYRCFMNLNSGLTALNGTVAISGAANGDVIFLTVIGR